MRPARVAVLVLAVALALPLAGPGAPSAGAQEPSGAGEQPLVYSVKAARAYSYETALRDEVLVAFGLNPCNPEKDPYQCDESRHNHELNCPPSIQRGPEGEVPQPEPPPVEAATGGAGDHAGPDQPPADATPVQIIRLLGDGSVGRLPGGGVAAAGVASSLFVDVSGRVRPEAHTQSDAAIAQVADYEERCFPDEKPGEGGVDEANYEHFLSRSGPAPGTYHLAECVGDACNLGAGFGAERARNIVTLQEQAGVVSGRLLAEVEGLTFAEERLRVDALITYVAFRSDGTTEGLEWTAVTTASGAKVLGLPVALPPGETVAGPGFSVGVAQPYVEAADDGSALTIIAPGLEFGNREQNAFFARSELDIGVGSASPISSSSGGLLDFGTSGGGAGNAPPSGGVDAPVVPAPDPPASTGLSSGFGTVTDDFDDFAAPGSSLASAPLQTPAAPPPPAAAPALGTATGRLTASIYEQATGIGLVASTVALGALASSLVTLRWVRRYPWGRRLHRLQPFRGIDWLYRAFVKT